MNRSIRVHLLPVLIEPGALAGGTAVVIDVLRATTTIATALAAGARCVIPLGEVDEARRLADEHRAERPLLGGERQGLRIPGFDLGNSPSEYTTAAVSGRPIVFTTTNGTRALIRAGEARRVATAAFANLNAIVQWLVEETGPIHLVCAGTDGRVTLEDIACAGAIALGLKNAGLEIDGDDATALALNLSESALAGYDRLLATLRGSLGGRNLVEHGMGADIVTAARFDTCPLVPELSREPWEIRPAHDNRPPGRRWVEPPPGR